MNRREMILETVGSLITLPTLASFSGEKREQPDPSLVPPEMDKPLKIISKVVTYHHEFRDPDKPWSTYYRREARLVCTFNRSIPIEKTREAMYLVRDAAFNYRLTKTVGPRWQILSVDVRCAKDTIVVATCQEKMES